MARVLNRERLKRKLIAVPEFVKAEIKLAMEQSAQEIVKLAQQLVPVRDGDLHDSIGWTWGDAPKGSIAIATVGAGKELRITIYAGDEKAYYARWVEFGVAASSRGQRITNRSGRSRVSGGATGQGPRPFFFPAYRIGRKKAKARVSRAVRKAAKRAATEVT
jgi:hypothetical protein